MYDDKYAGNNIYFVVDNKLENWIRGNPHGRKIHYAKYDSNEICLLAYSSSPASISIRKTKEKIIITVVDEGIGIPENVDLFAPFKRVGNQSGVGLGLFLAKNASDALRGKITLINREDGKSGCVAKLVLNNTSKK